jgi:hypothetical protein
MATDESVISPPSGGGILAQFHDQTTAPLSGVAVAASGPDSDAATSDSNGCVIFSALPTGSYNLAFTDIGYVDPNGNASPVSATASVASTGYAAPSDGNPVELGQGGGITGQFSTTYNGTNYPVKSDGLSWFSPGGAGIPMAGYRSNAQSLTSSISTTTASGTASSQGLFPFASSLNPVSYTNNYQVWAGKCLQEEPPSGTNMFSVPPGSSNTQTILVPALLLTTTYKAQNGTVTNVNPTDVRATFNSTSGTACGPDDWGPLTAASVPGLPTGQNVYGIPFASSATSGSGISSSGQTGTVTICADYTLGTSTYQASASVAPGYPSAPPQSLQIPYAATAPGKCT